MIPHFNLNLSRGGGDIFLSLGRNDFGLGNFLIDLNIEILILIIPFCSYYNN